MPPPPASTVASGLFLGPALRAQPDRRLVALVRGGYETAFEEIVHRYERGLRRYAAAIVPAHRAEDVTQDAFSKALLAMRKSDAEIQLRPWLFRIVRNTALNDLRDQPPPAQTLEEGTASAEDPASAAERRAEITELIDRLRALPESQRAAIVMRELEGLGHEEIAAALGTSGGGARQAIHRARRALRDGFGSLLPVPVLHYLLAPRLAEAGAAGVGLGGAAAGAGVAAGGGTAVKAGLASVLVAGTVATGVVVEERSGRVTDSSAPASSRAVERQIESAEALERPGGPLPVDTGSGGGDSAGSGRSGGDGESSGPSAGSGTGRGEVEAEEDRSGSNSGPSGDAVEDGSTDSSGPGGGDSSGSGSSGSGSEVPESSGSSGSGSGSSGSDSGSSGSGSASSGSGSSDSGSSGSDSSDSDSSGSGSSGSGSGSGPGDTSLD